MSPLDFTVPPAGSSGSSFSPNAPPPAPALAEPTLGQRFLLFLRAILAWWIEWIDRQLGA